MTTTPEFAEFPWHLDAHDRDSGVVALPSWIAPQDPTPAPPPDDDREPPSISAAMPIAEERRATVAPPTEAPVAPETTPAPRASRSPSVAPRSTRGTELAIENAALRTQLADLAFTIARLRRDVVQSAEPELVRLACAVAVRAVGRAVDADPALYVAWVRDAIAELPTRIDVTIAVSPDVAAALPPEAWDGLGAAIEVDDSLGRARCEVRAGASSIEVSAEGRAEAVAAHLGVDVR